jgi:hypothetical protein
MATSLKSYILPRAHSEFFIEDEEGIDPEAIYNLCLTLKTIL